jgi:hypothetical protein
VILVGDIASPDKRTSLQLQNFFNENSWLFKGERLICNFEGLLNDNMINYNTPVLFNHSSVLKVLRDRGEVFAGLANNHILDLPDNFDKTLKAFHEYRIDFAGAGRSKDEAEIPSVFYEVDNEVIIYNACWDFLLYNHKNPRNGVHIAVIKEEELINSVSLIRSQKPEATIIVFLHWNFDLETIPFPMHRQFSKNLIDKGADLIVGTHSHCVQGGEKYKNGYIIYGLGNFFIPHSKFANGKLSFPPMSDKELVLEWNKITRKAVCHWFEYNNNDKSHQLKYLGSSDFETCDRLKEYSVYREMSDGDYIDYFKKNRRKRILIPIFQNYKRKKVNKLLKKWCVLRAKTARILAKINILNWQN